jgi:hypothetical protein
VGKQARQLAVVVVQALQPASQAVQTPEMRIEATLQLVQVEVVVMQLAQPLEQASQMFPLSRYPI